MDEETNGGNRYTKAIRENRTCAEVFQSLLVSRDKYFKAREARSKDEAQLKDKMDEIFNQFLWCSRKN